MPDPADRLVDIGDLLDDCDRIATDIQGHVERFIREVKALHIWSDELVAKAEHLSKLMDELERGHAAAGRLIDQKPDFYCKDSGCDCHTDPKKRVLLTPFPLEVGPIYCCSRCASAVRKYPSEVNQ